LPAFLRRRQTELKIGLPVLAALILAAVLFKVLQSSRAPADSLATPLEPLQPVQVEPRAGAAQPAAPAPTIRVVPGGSAVVAAPAAAAPALPPGVQPVGPTPGVPPSPVSPAPAAAAPGATPPPAAAPAAVSPAAPAAAQPARSAPPPRSASSAPKQQRRPSLKQIGIEE
jgi:hypothetical protein